MSEPIDPQRVPTEAATEIQRSNEAVTRALARLDARSGRSEETTRLEKLEATMRLLSQTVSTLAGTVSRIAEDRPDLGQSAGSPTTVEPANLAELVEWVNWLMCRYETYVLPKCWTEHSSLVEELDALRAGWLDSIGNNSPGRAAIQWHDDLARTLDRIQKLWRTSCQDGTHRPTEAPSWYGAQPETPPIDLSSARYRPSGPAS